MGTIAEKFCAKTPDQAIAEIRAKMAEAPHEKRAAYSLILGAGFSYGIVPLARDLVHEHIGDYFYPNQSDVVRQKRQKRKLSASFWRDFNATASLCSEPVVELNEEGLPEDGTKAYQRLFTGQVANALFSPSFPPGGSFIKNLENQRRAAQGMPRTLEIGVAKSANAFLKHVLDPGGTGRIELNAAHFFLAALLELQQTGELWKMRPFCRTIFTTNFDTLLQNALQLVSIPYLLTDRPELGLDASEFPVDESTIHVVYTHGSILRYNPASTVDELTTLSGKNAASLQDYLEARDILVFGYGGWDDSLMSALARCDPRKHRMYWCNVYPDDASADKLGKPVCRLLTKYGDRASYVSLGSEGADGFMARLYRALAPTAGVPALLRNPIREFHKRIALVKLDKLIFTGDEPGRPTPHALPTPRLEMAAGSIWGMTCRALEQAREIILPASLRGRTKSADGEPLPRQRSARAEARACALLVEGFALAQTGDRNAAKRMWSAVVKMTDAPPYRRADAANCLGIIQAQSARNDLAIRAYGEAIRFSEESPGLRAEAFVNRGVAHQQSGAREPALEDFSSAIGIWREWQNHPRAVSGALAGRALVYRGLTYQMNGDVALAQLDFDQALTLNDLSEESRALLFSRDTFGKD
jgi:hypothetical protein